MRSATGAKLGSIDSSGTVRSATGAKIGKASGGNNKATAAKYFFNKK